MPSSSFFSGTNPTPTEYENAVDLVAQATTQATAALNSATTATTASQSAQGYSVSAGTSADTATAQAAAASTSATSASNSASAAATSATAAGSSASAASSSASSASTSATNAANSATSAAGSATSASTYATNAANSATAAANSASDAAATLASALVKTNNLSDLSNASTARSNLGLAIGTNVQAWDADLDAIAGISSTSGLLKKTAANTWSLDTTSYHSGTLGLSQGGTGATDAAGARTALGLGTAATAAATSFAQVANNLSDLVSAATARTNLGLGSAATLASSAVLQSANNLSDLGNVTTARSSLGLSTLATTTPGTGVATALGVAVGSAGAFVTNGGALGTPSSGTLTNCTGLPAAGVTGLATVATTGAYSDLSGKPTLGSLAALSSINNSNWSGTQLSVANGGTGLTSLTSGYIPYGNGTGAFSSSSGLQFDGSNLGLGVTPSAWTGKAFEFGYTGSALFTTAQGQSIVTSNTYYSGSSYKYASSSLAASYYQQYAGAHQWYTAPSGTAGSAISFTQAMTLDASGNLGIGYSSPAARLHVYSGGSTQAIISSGDTTTTYIRFINTTNNAGYIGYSSDNLVFLTGGTERARIDSSGNLLVGTTGVGTSAAKVIGMANATAPSSSPAGMGQLYVESGALKYRGSSGTVTTLGLA